MYTKNFNEPTRFKHFISDFQQSNLSNIRLVNYGIMFMLCSSIALTHIYNTKVCVYLLQNASLEIIKEEWFNISSGKLSEPHQVEDFMSSFNEISRRLMEYVVNIQDSNVRIFRN